MIDTGIKTHISYAFPESRMKDMAPNAKNTHGRNLWSKT